MLNYTCGVHSGYGSGVFEHLDLCGNIGTTTSSGIDIAKQAATCPQLIGAKEGKQCKVRARTALRSRMLATDSSPVKRLSTYTALINDRSLSALLHHERHFLATKHKLVQYPMSTSNPQARVAPALGTEWARIAY